MYPRRVTIAMWRKLFDSIEAVPQLLISVITAAPHDKAGFLVNAVRESFDDVVRVTSVLAEMDVEYIDQNASFDQLIAYYKALSEENNFGELVKNGRSVLAMIMPNLTRIETQDAS